MLNHLTNVNTDVSSVKLIYSGEFSDVWAFSKEIEKLEKLTADIKSFINYVNIFEEGQIEAKAIDLTQLKTQLKTVFLHLINSMLICSKTTTIKAEKSFLIRGNPILKDEYFSIGCITMASLCPIFLAFRIKTLAIYMRLIGKVLQKIFAIVLIYANIIILFKNIFVQMLYKNYSGFQPNSGYLSAISKTLAMMTGELTYEETFTVDSFIQQVVFIFFVFLLTILLNNLLIGLTTSNVEAMMKEAHNEKTKFMLQDIISFYEKRPQQLQLQVPDNITIHIVPKDVNISGKMRELLLSKNRNCNGLKNFFRSCIQKYRIVRSVDDLCEVQVTFKNPDKNNQILVEYEYVKAIEEDMSSPKKELSNPSDTEECPKATRRWTNP